MTLHTGLRRIASSIPSHRVRENCDSYKPLKHSSIKVTKSTAEVRLVNSTAFVGWQVGSDPEIQVATVVSNHLVAGIMKYFGDSGRYQPAANLFEKLSTREPEVASLLARSYVGMSESCSLVLLLLIITSLL